jgi:MFS family permease
VVNRQSRTSDPTAAHAVAEAADHTGVTPPQSSAAAVWRLHRWSAILLGVWAGVALHSEYLLLKVLDGNDWHVAMLTAIGGTAMFAGVLSGPLMEGRSKRPFFILVGGGGRVGLLIMAAANDPSVFLIGFAVFSLSDAFLVPALTSFYQANYPPAQRGRYFGRFTRAQRLTLIGVSLIAGWWLTSDGSAFRGLMILSAATGVVGWWVLAKVPSQRNDAPASAPPASPIDRRALHGASAETVDAAASQGRIHAVAQGFDTKPAGNPVVRMWRLFADDRRFLRFELQFMLYGLAFLSAMAVIPGYVTTSYPDIEFSQIAVARGLLFQGMLAIGVPLVAQWFRDRTPMAACTWSFLIVAASFGVMAAAPHLDAELAAWPVTAGFAAALDGVVVLYLGFLLFGFGMAGVMLVWNLASIHFAGDREATAYQGAHTVMVGFRAVTAPFLGVWIATGLSATAAFGASIALLVLAAALMAQMARESARPGE